MSFLGIDFGTKNIGIAVSDEENRMAFPLKTVKKNDLFSFLEKIIKERNVEKIVVGIPLNLKMKKTNQTNLTFDFLKKLKKRFKIEVVLENEFYTSKQAEKITQDMKKKDIDAVSAALILQSHLDKIKR